jgi:LuxR family quorum-sensing system transcriptional regulator CciR
MESVSPPSNPIYSSSRGQGYDAPAEVQKLAIGRIRRAKSNEEVRQILEAASHQLGFAHVALVTHATQPRSADLQLTSAGWYDLYQTLGDVVADPFVAACRTRLMAFAWSDIEALLRLSTEQRTFLLKARKLGLKAGITVPLHLPGVRTASCSFASVRAVRMCAARLGAAQLIAQAAFEACVRLDRRLARPVRLTPRQRDCVALSALGLADALIARRLKLSEESVTKYLNAARRVNGFTKRTQLIVAALRDGEIAADPVLRD